MSLFSKIFAKKPKEFKAQCALSNEVLETGYGFLLTTAEVIQSRKFWDNKMTEPDTMSYSINHFSKQDATATQIRSMIFDKFSQINKPWIISDTFINWFDIDKDEAKNNAKLWWDNRGEFEPEQSGSVNNVLEDEEYKSIKEYAIMEAGREQVAVAQKIAV